MDDTEDDRINTRTNIQEMDPIKDEHTNVTFL